LFQFAVELLAAGPIYWTVHTTAGIEMQPDTILKFLADSRRYLDR